jgi:hypothetical protein
MTIFIVLLAAGAILPAAWFALSKNSPVFLRRAAMIALALIALSALVSAILIFGGPVALVGPAVKETPVEPPGPAVGAFDLVIFAVVLLASIGVIILVALREQARNKRNNHEPH